MIKYSFLIPAYNRVNETEVAIKSILKQKIKDYEIIVLDDKSIEDFSPLIAKYNKVIFLKHDKNGGLSKSRNDLVNACHGKYFIFLDNDDYIEDNFLDIVDNYITEDTEILSFTNDEILNGKVVKEFHKTPFEKDNGLNIMTNWIQNGISFDSACFYVYNTEYFRKNNFKYVENRHHEDFGLTPIVISKANKMISIDKILYHVVLSNQSIIRGNDNEKLKRNIYDKLYHYDNLMLYFKNFKEDKNKKVILSFLSNVVLNDINKLRGKDKKEFIKELKKREVTNYLLDDNLKRKIKKILISIKYMWR